MSGSSTWAKHAGSGKRAALHARLPEGALLTDKNNSVAVCTAASVN